MSAIKILPDIYSVGVVDWEVRTFHGHTYTTRRGTSYNAYLILDDKITLVDTVYGPFSDELIENIRQITPLEKIDYIIANHIETDHSGALSAITKLAPQAKVVGTQKCKEWIDKHYSGNLAFQTVKTLDKIKLGRRSLTFIEAAMIHWPDSMFSYCQEEQMLLSNDAFGQHYATSERFDDETDQCALTDESKKYYANILWPFSSIILKKIEEMQKLNLSIKMIAPSHGVIWRSQPDKIIQAYLSWAKNEAKPKVVIVYETMWGSTQKMAHAIAAGLTDAGIENKVFDIASSDRTEVLTEMLDAKGFLIGSSTHDNGMLPSLAAFLGFLKGLKAKNRLACVFGSYGWAGGAVKEMEEVIKGSGIALAAEGLGVKYAPDANEIKQCYEYGRNFANQIK